MDGLLSIGEVARLAGVSVQTLRHYDQLGLLKPSHVTQAGYRLYSDSDCTRMELVRTLRGLGFDLDTIAGLLKGQLAAADVVGLQLQALEVQMRSLKRQQTVLKAVAKGNEGVVLSRLQRMQALAGLDKLERESFLSEHLKKGMDGQTGSPEVWKAAVLDLPEELNEEQLEAWLELAEIAASESFQQTLRNQMQLLAGLKKAQAEAWGQQLQGIIAQSIKAVQAGQSPTSQEGQRLIEDGLDSSAKLLKRKSDARFARWVLEYFESTHHPHMDRYWELVARLKGWQYTPIYAQAFQWLLEGLRFKAGSNMRPK